MPDRPDRLARQLARLAARIDHLTERVYALERNDRPLPRLTAYGPQPTREVPLDEQP